jgi:transposase
MGDAIRPRDDLVLTLPPRLEDWAPADHPARFIRDFVDSLDLAALGFKIRESNIGESPYATELLLRVWLYGFFERFRSVRRLEWACLNVLPVLWLTGMQAPDHNTLWRFWRDNREALRKLFKTVLQVAAKAGLVGMVLHAIDGTKIQARCSTDTAHHAALLKKALKKIDALIEEMMTSMKPEDAPAESGIRLPEALKDVQARREAIRQACQQLEQAQTEHLHPKEPEARIMRGRGGALRMSYNAQAGADAESGLIVGLDVVNEESDSHQMVPMLQTVEQTLGERAEQIVFDAGYVDGPQLEQAQEQSYPVLLQGLDQDGRRNENDPFDKCHFHYDAERDGYVCPREQFLPFERLIRKSKNDTEGTRVYRCHTQDCPVRAQCTKDRKGRTVGRTQHDSALEKQRTLQQDPDHKALMARRKVIIEPIFGILKWNQGFRRFTVAGLEKVRAQWAIVCTVFNLRKLYLLWKEGTPLFERAVSSP